MYTYRDIYVYTYICGYIHVYMYTYIQIPTLALLCNSSIRSIRHSSFERHLSPFWSYLLTISSTSFYTCMYASMYVEINFCVYFCLAAVLGVSHCNTLQHTATHCNTLQHTATHCNTLQHTANVLTVSATSFFTCMHACMHANINICMFVSFFAP